MTWHIFKSTFLDRFFPREIREDKVADFINICEGEKIIHDYSLVFIKLSKYAPSLISNPSDQISHFCDGGVGGLTGGVPIGNAT